MGQGTHQEEEVSKPVKDRVRIEDRGYETPCHIWLLSLNSDGYGHEWDPDRKTMGKAHILAYERTVGPVPTGLLLDHKCRVRCCVNPDHLEPVTPQENARRCARTDLERVGWEALIEACEAVDNGESQTVVAARYDISKTKLSAMYVGWQARRMRSAKRWGKR
jgi:hypothetical protein